MTFRTCWARSVGGDKHLDGSSAHARPNWRRSQRLAGMIQKRGRHLLLVAMLATVPCPSVFLFCNGLMPVSALGLGLVKFVAVALRDPIALVFAIVAMLYGVVYGTCLYWLAGFLSRKLPSYRILTGWRARGLLMAALLILAILPVYSFDCMDGRSSRWCNWYELHAGWFGAAEACGDFHW